MSDPKNPIDDQSLGLDSFKLDDMPKALSTRCEMDEDDDVLRIKIWGKKAKGPLAKFGTMLEMGCEFTGLDEAKRKEAGKLAEDFNRELGRIVKSQ